MQDEKQRHTFGMGGQFSGNVGRHFLVFIAKRLQGIFILFMRTLDLSDQNNIAQGHASLLVLNFEVGSLRARFSAVLIENRHLNRVLARGCDKVPLQRNRRGFDPDQVFQERRVS